MKDRTAKNEEDPARDSGEEDNDENLAGMSLLDRLDQALSWSPRYEEQLQSEFEFLFVSREYLAGLVVYEPLNGFSQIAEMPSIRAMADDHTHA